MKIKELFENTQDMRLVAILPGRFQPPHPGHLHGYLKLVKEFGHSNVYISMSDKIDPITAPLSYDERKEIFTKLLGVPSDQIIKVNRPYNVEDTVKALDLDQNTAIALAISKKDSAENRFSIGTKKDGSESYMKILEQNEILYPYKKHCYVIEYPFTTFTIDGKKLNSASQLRELLRNADMNQKENIFKEIYGIFDERIFKVFLDKFVN